MRMLSISLVALAAAVALAAPALAVDLKSSDITQEGKRVTLHLRFSGSVEYETVAHYAKNQLILHVTGLKLTKQQLKSGIAVKGNLGEAVDGIALDLPKGQLYGEIRLQLQKAFNPGDAQIIPRDSIIDIEFIVSKSAEAKPGSKPAAQPGDKPASKPSGDKPADGGWPPPVEDEPLTTLTGQRFDSPLTIAPASTADGEPVQVTDDLAQEPDGDSGMGSPADADSGFTADPPDAPTEDADAAPAGAPLDKPFSPDELAQFSGMPRSGDAPPAAAAGADSGSAATDTHTDVATSVPPETQPTAVSSPSAPENDVDIEPAPAATPPAKPAAGLASGPSYRGMDLGSVPVNQREYKNVPFREAILDLVAGCGFNVVVGEGIDNESVYLNFKQKELSLKSALETLCTVYELAYSVTDDVITITRQ
jgi:hypothetical protein